MVDPTENHDFPVIGEGEEVDNWGAIINEQLTEELEDRVPVVDVESELSTYTPHEDAIFVARDTYRVFVGDGGAWVKRGGSDSERIEGTTHFESVDVENSFTDPADRTHTEQLAQTDDNVEDFATDGDADTVPVSQGDGTIQMEIVDTGTETDIDLITVQGASDLPDPDGLDDATVAYIEDDDDYVGVFQE